MQFTMIHIKNFKGIAEMRLSSIEDALILVGQNNTGKSSILDAIRLVCGHYTVSANDFNKNQQNIEILISLRITADDLHLLHQQGKVSQYKRFEVWKRDFCEKLPSYQKEQLEFECVVNWQMVTRYGDGRKKHNRFIKELLPRIFFIDTEREAKQLQEGLLLFSENEMLKKMRANRCMFTAAKSCNQCFQCIGLINQKAPSQLDAFETAKLLEYKLYQLNLNEFAAELNRIFRRNGGFEEIQFSIDWDIDQVFKVSAWIYSNEHETRHPVEFLSKGMKSIYLLSLLEAYIKEESHSPGIIVMEDPEIFLHPTLQKAAAEILYRLSKRNQVIFTTYSPNLLFPFNSRQIRQVVLDREHRSVVQEKTSIDAILDDLGYGAGDFLNVGFVFIVEGKQDKNRLPLLLGQFYSELYDESGQLARVAIISTNSCTNIKTYANLKYMNNLYLRDQFLMIRDGDGKDPEVLARELCRYYDERALEDADRIPKITRRNVLILKYYSFENYFLNPQVMTALGIIASEEAFYEIILAKWNQYLHRLKSGQKLLQVIGKNLVTTADVKEHLEAIKIHIRGHNLYDIFYGPYRKEETSLLKKYLSLAPIEDFADIFQAINRFAFFDNRRNIDD